MKVLIFLRALSDSGKEYFKEVGIEEGVVYNEAREQNLICLPSWGSNRNLGPKITARVEAIHLDPQTAYKCIFLTLPEERMLLEVIGEDSSWTLVECDGSP